MVDHELKESSWGRNCAIENGVPTFVKTFNGTNLSEVELYQMFKGSRVAQQSPSLQPITVCLFHANAVLQSSLGRPFPPGRAPGNQEYGHSSTSVSQRSEEDPH